MADYNHDIVPAPLKALRFFPVKGLPHPAGQIHPGQPRTSASGFLLSLPSFLSARNESEISLTPG